VAERRVRAERNGVRPRDGEGSVVFDTRAGDAQLRIAEVLWSGPFPPHSAENVGDAELRVIMVEIKDGR